MSKSLKALQGQDFVSFIHSFGLLRTDTTPCGQPMSISTAHALCELRGGRPPSQSDLATRLGLTTSSVSRLVDQLETKGWANRFVDPDGTDSRVRLVGLTDPGSEVADQIIEARANRFAELLEAVPAGKRSNVLEALTLLKDAADAIA